MNSDMSIRIIASSLPNMNSASARTSSVFPTPEWAEEDKRADRSTRVLRASPRPADRLGDHRDRLVLTLDPVVERLFHLEEPARLLLGDPHHRDAGPHRDHVRDVLGRHHRLVGALLGLPAGLDLLQLGAELRLLVAVLGS